jgi:hypothetical protein
MRPDFHGAYLKSFSGQTQALVIAESIESASK